jgi:hypothetical protein
VLLVLAWAAHAWTSVAFAVGYDDGDVAFLAVLLSVGLVLVPPYFAVYTPRAFRWIAGTYGVVAFLGFFAGGLFVAGGVVFVVAAAFAPPPPDDWLMPRALVGALVATTASVGLAAAYLTVR